MLPGFDNPGKHSLGPFYSNIIPYQFEYYYNTLASPGRLYPCRWHHTRDHTNSLLAPPTEAVSPAEPRIELEPDRLTSRVVVDIVVIIVFNEGLEPDREI